MKKITDNCFTNAFWLDGSGSNTSDPLPFPYLSALPSETEDDDATLPDDDSDDPDDPFSDDSFEQSDPKVKGIIEAYLASVKKKLVQEISSCKIPSCYAAKTFWINPLDHFFCFKKISGVFRWIKSHVFVLSEDICLAAWISWQRSYYCMISTDRSVICHEALWTEQFCKLPYVIWACEQVPKCT